MTISLSNSLAGLSLLTGVNGYSSFGATDAPETVAVRKAKAAFTTPVTTPPWKLPAAAGVNDSTQLTAIKRMASIIDKVASGAKALPQDVQTSFTTYKALDRLRIMAETAGKSTTSSAERDKLNQLFAKGMADLQTYLGQAPSDKLDISFGNPTRRADSVGVAAAPSSTIAGKPLVTKRTDPLAGLTGTEQFTITLKTPSGNATEQFSVDLSQGTQPPTLDSIADQINAAISATPLLDENGVVQLDDSGNPKPRWQVKLTPTKTGDQWGFQFNNPQMSQISIDQTNGKDALMVATGQRAADASISRVQMLRLDDPANGGTKVTLGNIAAYDRLGTESAKLEAAAKSATVPKGVTLSTPYVEANTTASAMITGPDGATYVVGTAAGELGGNRPAGSQDLYLTKTDSEGKVLWQRMLGASESASGAAISFAANGDVLVAGTVTGGFGGDTSDGDMLVARFDTSGEEKFATLVRSLGADSATAITSGADGSIYVGGQAGEISGDAVIAKLDSTGKLTERRTIGGTGNQTITALAMGSDGNLVALSKENGQAVLRKIDTAALSTDLASLSLGSADARALAVGSDGTIAVGGATLTPLNGSQVNGLSANREGFVARIDAGLGSASVSYIGTDGTDEIDSIAFMNGRIYAGGRTTGVLSGSKTGITDGFVASFDPADGSQLSVQQFGQMSQRTEAVRISAAQGGSTALGALGFARGSLTTADSESLVAQTTLRPGDSFKVKVSGGIAKKITIEAEDTMQTLSDKVRKALGSKATVSAPLSDGKKVLRIEAKTGSDIELIAGPEGTDALEKLGMTPTKLTVPYLPGAKDPKVSPGGTYGLSLSFALSLEDKQSAEIALKKVKEAISTSQTAYRSLYWDDMKAKLVNGATGGGTVSAYQAAQAGRYQAALDRISAFTGIV